ncbi:MAG: phosphosulfolactate synthase, partial [Verrucomicrobia bacterium]
MTNTKSGRKKAGPSQGERGFQFLRTNPRPDKPRQRGITEIRGPYYSVIGQRYLHDLLETMGAYVDSLKFGGGSFCLMPRKIVRQINDLCHENEVTVSTGGFIEFVLAQGHEAVRNYIRQCKELGFDTIEV